MAISHAEQVVARADADWRERVVRGLVSGEGVIWNVRDAVVNLDDESGAERIIDVGISDKRLLVREDELASVLAAMGRDGSTLSGVLRDAWDGRRLQTLAKRSPAVATGAHVSILAAITPDEALRKLTATEQANGFANRFLWLYVERSQLLPEGAPVDEPFARARARARRRARPGATRRRRPRSGQLLKEGEFRAIAGRLGLFQELAAAAGANVYCLADLEPILARFGNRGYRAAQLEGGIVGGRLYLAAHALRFGAPD